jgi:hypothetical protein
LLCDAIPEDRVWSVNNTFECNLRQARRRRLGAHCCMITCKEIVSIVNDELECVDTGSVLLPA